VLRFDCELFPACDLRVTWGTYQDEVLGDPTLCLLGDIYTLMRTDRMQSVVLTLGDVMHVRATVQDNPLAAGAIAEPCARLNLMAADGDRIEVLVLRINGQFFALPLSPLRPGTGYGLIALDLDDPGPALVQMVQGCFGAGVRITLANGALVPVEDLEPGQMILTRDHGAQPLRWVGKTTLRASGQFAPVVIGPGILGNLRELVLSPYHRIFLYQRNDKAVGGRAEILVQARRLVDGRSIQQREGGFATYHSLAFDDHQIVYAEGVPVESLLVSRATIARLPEGLARDLKERFPNLDQHAHFAQDIDQITR
jgi:hypothetical protein